VGLKDKEEKVNGRTTINIIMQTDSKMIDEVVVIGYGTQRRGSVTGAVSAVKGQDMIKTKNENPQNMLTGRIPGLRVWQKSSEPGTFNNSFDIRGMGSPLIIIDGIPRSTEEFQRLNAMDIDDILVKEHLVNGWDDPRMPTLCGFRRRGYSPESIRKFVDKIGYTTYDALNDFALLESAVREDLNSRATRVSAVINPVKLIITNYPEGQVEEMEAVNNPEDPSAGTHTIEFSRELWIERDDFMEDAPKKYFRMTPGQEVRLKSGYIVKCTGCKKDDNGNVVEVYCEYDPDSKTGMPGSNRKIKGTIHWVSCAHCLPAEVRLYDRLWKVENPRDEMAAIREAKNCDALEAMKEMINPDSLNVLTNCYVEKYLADAKPLDYLQFQRIGYFNVDKDSTPEHLVFNRTVSLKDTWSKINK
jgi:glutaminyl-tRNA synthetase